ncbi:circadian clock protein KaiC [Candidatus Woesearchaeota archaeon]|nr:MAG: circadian clock protein KaiC [Candidatus Woesearchaeota archaeon]
MVSQEGEGGVFPVEIKRIRTYVKGLDEHIQGGIPEGHLCLISGTAGSMKSSLCFSIQYNEALNGRTSLYISLEQSAESLVKHMSNLGLDLGKIELVTVKDLSHLHQGLERVKENPRSVIIVDVGAIRKEIKDLRVADNRSWLNAIKNIVKKVRAETPCSLFTLDSMSALYVLSKFENPRIELFYFFEFLRDLGMTSLLISEQTEGKDTARYAQYELEEFLSDGIVQLRLTPFRRNVVREINVVKMRATKVRLDIFSLEFKNGAFHALYGGQNPLL